MYSELQIVHISGPMEIGLNREQGVVLCVVKNGEHLIESYIDYYMTLGFRHIAFLDNNSTDQTIRLAAKNSNVTVLQTKADFRKNKLKFKHALMKLFGIGTWFLIADIDEFFYYPMMDCLGLADFLNYLNANKFDSVVAQLIDMFPDNTLGEIKKNPIFSIGAAKWFYSCSQIEKTVYDVPSNTVNNTNISFWNGGGRKYMFDMDGLMLTKHPLNFGDGPITITSNHVIGRRNVADVSGIMAHYKYVGDVYSHAKDAVVSKQYYRESREYVRYLEQFDSHPDLKFDDPSRILFTGYPSLESSELFVSSEHFKDYVNKLA